MVLDTKNRAFPVDQTLHRTVVQIDVGQAQVRSSRNLPLVTDDGKPVVLRRDLDGVQIEIAYRVVCSVVAEGEFIRLGAEGPSDQLVAQTDSEDRNAALG